MINTQTLILPPDNSVPRPSSNFSCVVHAQINDWHNQCEIFPGLLISDLDSNYDGSMPTALIACIRWVDLFILFDINTERYHAFWKSRGF